jgi:hypothetical protein
MCDLFCIKFHLIAHNDWWKAVSRKKLLTSPYKKNRSLRWNNYCINCRKGGKTWLSIFAFNYIIQMLMKLMLKNAYINTANILNSQKRFLDNIFDKVERNVKRNHLDLQFANHVIWLWISLIQTNSSLIILINCLINI